MPSAPCPLPGPRTWAGQAAASLGTHWAAQQRPLSPSAVQWPSSVLPLGPAALRPFCLEPPGPRDEPRLHQRSTGTASRASTTGPGPGSRCCSEPCHRTYRFADFLLQKCLEKILIMWLFQLFGILLTHTHTHKKVMRSLHLSLEFSYDVLFYI